MGQADFIQGIVTPSGIVTEIGPLIQPVSLPPGSLVEVALRADDVSFHPDPAGSSQVAARHYRGATNLHALRLPSGRIVHSMQAHTLQLNPGARVQATAEPGHSLHISLRRIKLRQIFWTALLNKVQPSEVSGAEQPGVFNQSPSVATITALIVCIRFSA